MDIYSVFFFFFRLLLMSTLRTDKFYSKEYSKNGPCIIKQNKYPWNEDGTSCFWSFHLHKLKWNFRLNICVPHQLWWGGGRHHAAASSKYTIMNNNMVIMFEYHILGTIWFVTAILVECANAMVTPKMWYSDMVSKTLYCACGESRAMHETGRFFS